MRLDGVGRSENPRNRTGPVTEQPHLVLGEKQCSRLTPARQAGRAPLGATRSGRLTKVSVEYKRSDRACDRCVLRLDGIGRSNP